MKIYPVGAELYSVDERTERRRDTTKLRVAFPSLANETKNLIIQYLVYTDIRSDSGSIHVKKTK
jgi:hypothetical protein